MRMNFNRTDMFVVLILLTLMTLVWGVSHFQAAEGADVTLQWYSPVPVEPSTLFLSCFQSRPSFRRMLEVAVGEQLPGPPGEHFSGRVWWDREALGLGHVQIVLSRVSAQDQGEFWCYMLANYQDGHWEHHSHEYFMLTVTRDKQGSEDKPTEETEEFVMLTVTRHKQGSENKPREQTKDGFPESELGLVQRVLLYLMFSCMTVMALCIVFTWAVLRLATTREPKALLPV